MLLYFDLFYDQKDSKDRDRLRAQRITGQDSPEYNWLNIPAAIN